MLHTARAALGIFLTQIKKPLEPFFCYKIENLDYFRLFDFFYQNRGLFPETFEIFSHT